MREMVDAEGHKNGGVMLVVKMPRNNGCEPNELLKMMATRREFFMKWAIQLALALDAQRLRRGK
jgi:hypothetical protein